jgi:hypothetical protein
MSDAAVAAPAPAAPKAAKVAKPKKVAAKKAPAEHPKVILIDIFNVLLLFKVHLFIILSLFIIKKFDWKPTFKVVLFYRIRFLREYQKILYSDLWHS